MSTSRTSHPACLNTAKDRPADRPAPRTDGETEAGPRCPQRALARHGVSSREARRRQAPPIPGLGSRLTWPCPPSRDPRPSGCRPCGPASGSGGPCACSSRKRNRHACDPPGTA
eukprot:1335780-Alexandrium_andersonii.AAC.1